MLTTTIVYMYDRDYKYSVQLHELLALVDMVRWSGLPYNGLFRELPATPGSRSCRAEKLGKLEGGSPAHDERDWVAFDAVNWDVIIPKSYFVSEVEERSQV